MSEERICHLNIVWSGKEDDRQILSILNNYFTGLEKYSQKRGFDKTDSISWTKIGDDMYLTSFMSGRDMFLSVLDINKWQLNNTTKLENIKYMNRLPNKMEKQLSVKAAAPPKGLEKLWGAHVAKVRREEAIISRLPKGLSVTHTNEPFVIDIRKDPPFQNHDFAIRIDSSAGTCKTMIDGVHHPLDAVKTSYRKVYDLLNSVVSVCNGKDLSKVSARSILETDIDIDR